MNDHLIGEDITLFLEQDIKNTRSKSWNRLDKTTKLEKMRVFLDDHRSEGVKDEEIKRIYEYLRTCLDRKRLANIRDVDYDVSTSKIINIKEISFNTTHKTFTIKRRMQSQNTCHNKTLKQTRENSN